jgi:glycosyltransferase involved in cell wall biosynthesis
MTTILLTPRVWRILHYLVVCGGLAFWAVAIALIGFGKRHYKSLSQVAVTEDEANALPPVSVLVPACNEGETIERGMRSLLALDYPGIEIIAVDDRSTDATGEILDRLAASDPRLRVMHVTSLPDGWLGKNHAMQLAAGEATGQWLLFTDADVVFAPDTLRRAVAHCCRACLDHLVVAPRCETHGFWEKLFVSYFSLMFAVRVRPWEVANPRSRAYIGLGAFNLVSAKAYRSFGGHAALPMEVLDDTKLGKVIKRNGFRQALLEGGDNISVRWVVGLRGVMDGLMKNAYAGFDYNIPAEIAACAGLILTTVYPVFALRDCSWTVRACAAAAMGLMALGAGIMRRVTDAGPQYGLAYPLASAVLVTVIARSTWRAMRQGGIVWRGTLYPLDQLKRNVV